MGGERNLFTGQKKAPKYGVSIRRAVELGCGGGGFASVFLALIKISLPVVDLLESSLNLN